MAEQIWYETVYSDPLGRSQTGYIIDGKTYTDKEGTNRVPVGSVVYTLNGTFKMTETGGVPYMPGTGPYDSWLSSQQAASDLMTQQQTQRLENQKQGVNQMYDASQVQNTVNNAIEKENINRASVYGDYFKTGMPDSLQVAQSIAYQNLYNRTESERKQALTDIQNAIEDARLAGDLQRADALSSYYKMMAEYSIDQQNRQAALQASTQATTQKNDRDAALMLLNQGYYSDEVALRAGLSPTEARYIAAQAQAKLNGSSGGSGSGSSSSKSSSSSSSSSKSTTTASATVAQSGGGSLSSEAFSELCRAAVTAIARGDSATLNNLISSNYPYMTEEQKKTFNSIIYWRTTGAVQHAKVMGG